MFKLGKAEPMDYGNSHMAEAIKDRPLKAKTIKDRSHQSVSTGFGESDVSTPEQKQHSSIFIDESNEVAWGDTPKAVKTDW